MSTFTVHCRCGEPFHADDAAIGRHVVCRRCGNVTEIQRPAAEPPKARAPRRRKKRRDPARPATPSRQPVLVPRTGVARIVSWVVWAYLAAVVVIAAAMWTLGDRAIVGSVLLFMGRWVFLLPLALLLPATLWLRRDRLPHLILAAAIVVGPIMGFRTGWRRALPHPAGLPVRVATFNAEGGGVLAQMLPGLLARWGAQIVAFQECGESLAAAAARLSGWYHYEGKDLCLLSKYPIRRAEVMDRSGLDRVKQSEAKEIGGAGYVVRFVLDGPRGPIRVGNLHLETPRKGFEGLMDRDLRRIRMNTEIREVESDLARAWVDTGTGPLVVLGDFNTPVESRIFRDHWGDLADAFSTAGFGLGMTKYNGWIRARIDHVLTSDDWHVAGAHVGPDAFSDHRPLLVDLTLVGASAPPQRAAGSVSVKTAP
jgi:endonuclease/exonuclease/phosphatase (EEP) superfamily protein YafD